MSQDQQHSRDPSREPPPPERPSFESWWKWSKDVLKTRKITFVQAANQPGCDDPDASSSSQTPQDKAKARRAQVRRAQIEHRQRKANYVKQLEIDVARIRDMIAASQMEARMLQADNNAIRAQLAAASVSDQRASMLPPPREDAVFEMPEHMDMSFLDDVQLHNLNMTLTLGLDDAMHLPVYQISSEPTATTSNISPATTYANPLEPPRATHQQSGFYPFAQLSPEQCHQIINFILALEHICWDHFQPCNFQPDHAEPYGAESGHTLMASSLALRTAPDAIFHTMRTHPPRLPQDQPPSALAALLAATAETGAPAPPPITWPASGLTLYSLYGLASSVNAPDLDLAPVQAWFELAARYPLEVLLRRDVEDRLKREFVGLVKCPHYGAAIERVAFESVCARVLDPEVAGTGTAGLAGQ